MGAMDPPSPEQGGPPPGNEFNLILHSPEIQLDLGLTMDQLRRLQAIGDGYRARMQSLQQVGDPSEHRHIVSDAEYEWRTALGDVLNDRQKTRLEEIMLQVQGICYITSHPRLRERLNLARYQGEEIRLICRELAEPHGGRPGEPLGGPPGAGRPPMPPGGAGGACGGPGGPPGNHQAEMEQRLRRVLNADQQAELDRIMGPRIDLSRIAPPRC